MRVGHHLLQAAHDSPKVEARDQRIAGHAREAVGAREERLPETPKKKM